MSSTSGDPTIGLIIPTWNRAPVLARAIESVIDEGFDDIIVADDGSTDETAEVVARFGSVKYVRQEHSGANAARNLGALELDTDFVAFLDSDDIILPGFISAYRAAIATGADAVSSGFIREMPNGRRRHFAPEPLGPAFDDQTGCFEHGGTYALGRSLFWRTGGFDETMPASQHTELALRLLNSEPRPEVAVLSNAHCVYFANRSDGIRSDRAHVGRGAAALLSKHPDALAHDRARLSDHAGVACLGALMVDDGKRARRFAVQSVRATPTRFRAWGRLGVSLLPPRARRRILRQRGV